MIARLAGTLVEMTPDRLVIDVGGVGYELHVSLHTFYAVSDRRGRTVSVHVHTHVREDALTLFGFHDVDERAMFRHLVAIGGVGPRVALAMLSGISVDELRSAVANEDRARLQRIPGVGKKTAERVLLELGDRLSKAGSRRAPAPAPAASGDEAPPIRADAVSALVNLGYGEDVARRAVDAELAEIPEPRPGLEPVLRGALRRLVS